MEAFTDFHHPWSPLKVPNQKTGVKTALLNIVLHGIKPTYYYDFNNNKWTYDDIDILDRQTNTIKFNYLFKLFPCLQKIIVYTTSARERNVYGFSYDSLAESLVCPELKKHKQFKSLEIRAQRWSRAHRSWSWLSRTFVLRNVWRMFQQYCKLIFYEKKFKIKLLPQQQDGHGEFEDVLCIELN